MKHYVPRKPFIDLIYEYMTENNLSAAGMSRNLGFSESYIQTTVEMESERMEFTKADLLLCKMKKVYLWWEPPFDEWYWNGEVPPDKNKPVKCANPRCDEWFALELHGSHRKYCNDACKTMAGKIARKQAPSTTGEIIMLKCHYCGEEYEAIRISGGGAQTSRRKTCRSPECKRANKAALQRKYWERKKAAKNAAKT
jgi:hypothetical protein